MKSCRAKAKAMSQDPLRAYEYELIEQMETILHAFHFHLLDDGVSARQAEQQLANAELFLIQYHAYHYLDGLSSLTTERISDFLRVWYFERIESRSESDWKETKKALNRFLSYLLNSALIEHFDSAMIEDIFDSIGDYRSLESEYARQPLFALQQNDIPLEDILQDDAEYSENDNLIRTGAYPYHNYASFHDMVVSLQNDLPATQPRKNVIALMPMPPGGDAPSSTVEIEDVQKFILALLRGNCVFQRWLERSRHRLNDVRKALLNDYQHYQTLALRMHQLARDLPPAEEEATRGRAVLDQLDKQLWSLRNRIAAELRLDLRTLCL